MPPIAYLERRSAAAIVVVLALAGCGGPQLSETPRAGLNCVDDSAHCIGQRKVALTNLVDDRSRSWVKQPPSPEAYASGVRLFAYKKKKKDLSCEELSHARREAEAAPGVLRGSGGGRLTPAQVSRGVMLASEVSRELSREAARRCKKG